MTCKHDPLYRINNEAAGGAGCPICKANGKHRVMVAVDTADKCETKYDEAWFEHEVIAARAASTDPQYVSLSDLMRDYDAREDMRHLMSGKTA